MTATERKNQHRPGRRLLFAGVACVLAVGAMVAPGAAVTKERPHASLYWGAQIGDQITGEAAPWDMNAVQRFQQATGKGLSLIQFSSPFAECDNNGGNCVMTKFPST